MKPVLLVALLLAALIGAARAAAGSSDSSATAPRPPIEHLARLPRLAGVCWPAVFEIDLHIRRGP